MLKTFFCLMFGLQSPGDMAYYKGLDDSFYFVNGKPCMAFEDNCLTIWVKSKRGIYLPVGFRARIR